MKQVGKVLTATKIYFDATYFNDLNDTKTKRVITDTATVNEIDEIIVCNKATAMTVNLVVASASGRVLTIKNIGVGEVTINGDTSDTIDEETTQLLSQYDSMSIVDYAANKWSII